MVWFFIAISGGILALVWSAGIFIRGASSAAVHIGIPPLVVGMVIVGFGTSAPEFVVSTISALEGSPGISLGNAYGSNIINIAAILGMTAMINPVTVRSGILKRELPVLAFATALSGYLLIDLEFARSDALLLLALFFLLLGWTLFQSIRQTQDELVHGLEKQQSKESASLRSSIILLGIGLAMLIFSSRILVWGATGIARMLEMPEMFIGLTIVALGTSLPELASSIAAAKIGEHEIALGNIIGSNLFNTLAVAGISGLISPTAIESSLVFRDMLFMGVLTISIFVLGFGFKKNEPGRINRIEGAVLVSSYIVYTAFLVHNVPVGAAI